MASREVLVSSPITDTDLVLIGHDCPLGTYPSPVVPIASSGDQLFAIYSDDEHNQVQAINVNSRFVRYEPARLDRLGVFDHQKHRLFAHSEEQVEMYEIESEKEYFTRLLERRNFSQSNPFMRLSLAQATENASFVDAELRKCLENIQAETPAILSSWVSALPLDISNNARSVLSEHTAAISRCSEDDAQAKTQLRVRQIISLLDQLSDSEVRQKMESLVSDAVFYRRVSDIVRVASILPTTLEPLNELSPTFYLHLKPMSISSIYEQSEELHNWQESRLFCERQASTSIRKSNKHMALTRAYVSFVKTLRKWTRQSQVQGMYKTARDLTDALLFTEHRQAPYIEFLPTVFTSLAGIMFFSGDRVRAHGLLTSSMRSLDDLTFYNSGIGYYQHHFVKTCADVSSYFLDIGDLTSARKASERGLIVTRHLAANSLRRPEDLYLLGLTCQTAGRVVRAGGERRYAEELSQAGVEIARFIAKEQPTREDYLARFLEASIYAGDRESLRQALSMFVWFHTSVSKRPGETDLLVLLEEKLCGTTNIRPMPTFTAVR